MYNFANSNYLFLPASHCNLDVLRRLVLSRCCRRHCWCLMISRHNIRFREKSLVKKLAKGKKREKKDKFLLFSISRQKWQLKRHYNTHIYTLRRFYSTIFSMYNPKNRRFLNYTFYYYRFIISCETNITLINHLTILVFTIIGQNNVIKVDFYLYRFIIKSKFKRFLKVLSTNKFFYNCFQYF